MFLVTPDEKVQHEQTKRLHQFAEAMVNLVYWYSEPLQKAYERIEELEARNRELRVELETERRQGNARTEEQKL